MVLSFMITVSAFLPLSYHPVLDLLITHLDASLCVDAESACEAL